MHPVEIEIPVKMLVTRARTERPHGALLQLDTGIRYCMYRIEWEALNHGRQSVRRPLLGYHPLAVLDFQPAAMTWLGDNVRQGV